jgi:hypothetical protein
MKRSRTKPGFQRLVECWEVIITYNNNGKEFSPKQKDRTV